jgi:hypothetical protein
MNTDITRKKVSCFKIHWSVQYRSLDGYESRLLSYDDFMNYVLSRTLWKFRRLNEYYVLLFLESIVLKNFASKMAINVSSEWTYVKGSWAI